MLATENGQAYALSVEDGSIVWQKKVDGEILAKPLADENLVMFHTNKGSLIALKQDSGDNAWEISNEVPNLTLRGDSSPGFDFWRCILGNVKWQICCSIDSKVVSYYGNNRLVHQKAQQKLIVSVDVDASPLIIGSNLYAVGINGQLSQLTYVLVLQCGNVRILLQPI